MLIKVRAGLAGNAKLINKSVQLDRRRLGRKVGERSMGRLVSWRRPGKVKGEDNVKLVGAIVARALG